MAFVLGVWRSEIVRVISVLLAAYHVRFAFSLAGRVGRRRGYSLRATETSADINHAGAPGV